MTAAPAPGLPADLPGLPAAAADAWLRRELPELAQDGPWQAEIISGGLSNITYRLRLAGGTVILRRPPLGHLLPRAHDVAREHRVLAALAGTPVPVPAPLALCTDPGVLGAPFYLTPEVAGEVLRTAEDTARLDPRTRGQLSESLIAALVALHAVDPDAVGLGDFGRRSGYSERQLRTWGAQWERSRTRALPDMETLLAALADRVPAEQTSGIVHGDYRFDNTIVRLDGPPRVAAVLDWELSTLGDPLADLGLTLTYWHDVGDALRAEVPVAAGVTAWPGFPSSAAVAQRYAELSGRDLGDLGFYRALGAMKLAVILEGVHARFLSGTTVSDGYERAGSAVPALVAQGLRLLRPGAV
jgi:aminoglycoside phosphotransferase (APT) family kinase protein